METILKTSHLGIQFGGHKAVDDVSLEIPVHHFKSIIGPNGAGKTTFFNLISGELQATTGEVFFKGQNISKLSPGSPAIKSVFILSKPASLEILKAS